MDIADASLGEILETYMTDALAKRDVFLDGVDGLSDLSQQLQSGSDSTPSNIRIIVDYCKEAFPYLKSQAHGDLKGADFANSEGKPIDKKYTLDELWCRSISSAKLIYALENLCVSHNIYPPLCFSELYKAWRRDGNLAKLGSSLDMKSTGSVVCANWGGKQSEFCLEQATKQCTDCRLVSYCSGECQRDHWQRHKQLCKRLKSVEASTRETVEELDGQGSVTPNYTVLWDRVPGFGLLGEWQPPLGPESKELPNPLRLCFDGCFDLNNVVETLHQIFSEDYSGDATLYINCTNREAMARNIILCFMLASSPDDSALDAIIAVWYSAYLTPFQFLFLQENIRLILQQFSCMLPISSSAAFSDMFHKFNEDMEHIQDRLDDLETFCLGDAVGCMFVGQSRIRTRFQGFDIFKYLYAMALLPWRSEEIDRSRQASIRKFDSSAKLDDFLLAPHAAALAQFRHSGLVLPYSQFSGHHTLPNPTLFQAVPWAEEHGGGWTAKCNAVDPFSGWPINKVLKSTRGAPHNVPANDVFGSLYFFVRRRLLSAVKACRKCSITIEFSDKLTDLFVHDLRYKKPGLMSIYRAMAAIIPPACDSPTHWNLTGFLDGWAPVFTKRGDETLVLRWEPNPDSHDMVQAAEALSEFDIFIARFSDDKFAAGLQRYRAAIADAKVDMDRLSPLFLNDVTFLTRRYQELEEAVTAGEPPPPPPAMSRRSEHLASPSKPCTVAVGLVPGADRKLKSKQRARNDDSDKGTLVSCSETCYSTVMLTMLNHLTIFSEWSPNQVG